MTDQLPSGYRVQDGCCNCRHGNVYDYGLTCLHHGPEEVDLVGGWRWCSDHKVDPAGICPKYTKGDDDENVV